MRNIPKLIVSTNESHRFRHGKTELTYPRVTAVIKSAGFYDKFDRIPADNREAGLRFGTAVHLTCEYDDNGTLGTYDPMVAPYLDAWRRFRAEIQWAKKVLLAETVVYSNTWRYAGRLDRVFNGGMLVDIKTGAADIEAGIQTSAYAEAVTECLGIKIKRRFVVQLRPDGYRLLEFKDRRDINIFHACVNIHNYKIGGLK